MLIFDRDYISRPVSVPNTSDVTRSPTGSVRTILSIDSRSSTASTGSRSTIYVPPMSTLTDIPDFRSDFSSNSRSTGLGLARSISLASSHHKHTVDDTVIQNQEYVYPGDPRHIPPSRGSSLRHTGSDLDQEFTWAVQGKRSGLAASPVTISSGPSLGQDICVTLPPSVVRGSDRSRLEYSGSQSDEAFVSAGLSGSSTLSSTYYSQSGVQTTTGLFTNETLCSPLSGGTLTQPTPTLSYRGSDLYPYSLDRSSYGSASASPSGLSSLSHAREVRRRLNRISPHSMSTVMTDKSLDKLSGSGSYTFSGTSRTQSYGSSANYTPASGGLSVLSGSYTPGSADYWPCSFASSSRRHPHDNKPTGCPCMMRKIVEASNAFRKPASSSCFLTILFFPGDEDGAVCLVFYSSSLI